jgi:hypothetical protein
VKQNCLIKNLEAMKKILLSLMLSGAVYFSSAQVVLNEVYVFPGTGKHEFFELYNSSTFGNQNLDCFTLVTYWQSGANKGWYVIDLPNLNVGSKSYFVGAAANPFNVQAQTGVSANFNWNDAAFLAANNGYLKTYQLSGSSYTLIANPANLNDMFQETNFSGNGGKFYPVFLFQNGTFINGFLGGAPNGTLHSSLASLPNLDVDMLGACNDFTINFSALGTMEYVNQAPGSDNGFARTSDGKCGAWAKTAPGVSHTPGVTNGAAGGLTGSLTTSQLIVCSTPRYVTFDITGISGDVTEAADFPVEVQVYRDANNNGQLDGGDVYINSKFQATVAAPADSVTLTGANQNANLILVYKTKRGCFDKVVPVQTQCSPLPVKFTLFNATRTNASTVKLVWQTASEINNSGFEVQRFITGGWETMAFVPTQAPGGNSDVLLNYSYTDMNNAKGMTQYRIKQIDFDGKSEFSAVRAVRGEGVSVKTVVYPNPSMDGKVNVVFEDAAGTRDIVLMDMSGRMIRNWKGVANNNLVIDNLNPGMYSLRITVRETGAQTMEKIVVNKR